MSDIVKSAADSSTFFSSEATGPLSAPPSGPRLSSNNRTVRNSVPQLFQEPLLILHQTAEMSTFLLFSFAACLVTAPQAMHASAGWISSEKITGLMEFKLGLK